MTDIDDFIKQLKDSPATGSVFNPWYQVDQVHDATPYGPRTRREQLHAYLSERTNHARYLLIAEAPGFRGCKFSGIAMTCERQLGWRTSRPDQLPSRTDQEHGMLEPTAMIVERLLKRVNIDPRRVVLWNAFAWHPHKPNQPLTNRTPTPTEVQHGVPVLKSMVKLFPKAQIIAIGKTSERSMLELLGIKTPTVRHPANGGAKLFADQMAAILVRIKSK